MALSVGPWPMDKLKTALAERDLGEHMPAVVLGVGCMSPMHLGHTQMLWQAKQRLEEAGFAVLAGWLSLFASPKGPQKAAAAAGGSAANPMLSTAFRLRLAELSVLGDELVSVGPSFGETSGSAPLAPLELLKDLQATIAKDFADSDEEFSRTVRVFLVCGSDEISRQKRGITPDHLQGTVTVPRFEDELTLEKPHDLHFMAERCPGKLSELSSTKLWEAIKTGDSAYVISMMSEAAAQFILEGPSEAERAALSTDFARLAGRLASEGDWPGLKLMQRLPLVPDDKTLAVIVAGGLMSPMHRAHLLMLWQAKERLEQAGHAVAAAWLLPEQSGQTATQEAGANQAPGLSASFRQRIAELSVCDDEFVSVSSWATSMPPGSQAPSPMDVVQAIQQYLPQRFPCSLRRRPVHVFYVAGTDVAKQLGLYRGLAPQLYLGAVVVPRDGEEAALEKPHQMVYVADEISGESAAYSSTKLRSAIREGDMVYAAQAMASAAGRFTLSPTSSERQAFQADFQRLGVVPPAAQQLTWAKERLKASLRAWIGPQGTIHGDDIARLLKMLDPSWNSQEMSALMIGAKVAPDGYLVADDFVDWIFSCYSSANPS